MIPDKNNCEKFAMNVLDEVTDKMFGLDDVIRLCLVALYTRGHVLLEGNPGLGKTALVRTLSEVLGLSFGRIQFTPDLMPSDITGTLMPRKDNHNELGFQPGPIFTSLLLADEINRATPKTQAAMLEAMAERQVTVLGDTYGLDERDFKKDGKSESVLPQRGRPFMVLATQNPIDHEGTYDLPEAQSDRFMFKILMPVPGRKTLVEILRKDAGAMGDTVLGEENRDQQKEPIKNHNPEQSVKIYQHFHQKIINEVSPIAPLRVHILNLFLATNNRFDEIDTISPSDKKILNSLTDCLKYGLGPRAATALMLGAKAWTLFFTPKSEGAGANDLAKVILPTLRHRVRLQYGSLQSYQEKDSDMDADRLLDNFLCDLCTAAAPTKPPKVDDYSPKAAYRGYASSFKQALEDTIKRKVF